MHETLSMIDLNLLQYKDQLQVRTDKKGTLVFDPVRKKWFLLQPEELVRQLFIIHCLKNKLTSLNHISVERQISINQLKRRYDIALHDKSGAPWLLVECKAPSVPISQKTMDQIAHYNFTLKVPYLIVTNGIETYGCVVDLENKRFEEIGELPDLG